MSRNELPMTQEWQGPGQLSCRDTACRGGQRTGVRAGWHGGLGTSVRRGGHDGTEDARSGHTARRRPGWVPPGKHIRLPTAYPRTRLVITGMPFTRSTENHQALKWCGGQAMWPSESGPLARINCDFAIAASMLLTESMLKANWANTESIFCIFFSDKGMSPLCIDQGIKPSACSVNLFEGRLAYDTW